MFEPLVEVWDFLTDLVPRELKIGRPRLNFIWVHYSYLIGLTIIGSVMLYPAGGMAYIDALFFGAGMATQSGLNTLNVNDLSTYQQIVMMLVACIANPIFINTCVVFVRLYWFEKRFKHIVEEIRSQRRSRPRSMRSRTRSQTRDQVDAPDLHRLEMGVNGRPIKVLHETIVPNGMSGSVSHTKEAAEEFREKLGLRHLGEGTESPNHYEYPNSLQEEDEEDEEEPEPVLQHAAKVIGDDPVNDDEKAADLSIPSSDPSPVAERRLNREITFADEVSTEDRTLEAGTEDNTTDEPQMSKHIKFLERQQQNARTGTALHIPGPRDFERGEVPKVLYKERMHQPRTRSSFGGHSDLDHAKSLDNQSSEQNGDDHPPKRGITIDAPDHPTHRERETRDDTGTSTGRFEKIKSNISNRRLVPRLPLGGDGERSFSRTLSNMSRSRGNNKIENPSPYLSWQATTGRNSAFFGLTETQREELGGIEYRALKTLAIILLVYFIGFHLLGVVVFVPWIVRTAQWRKVVVGDGQIPAWWGIFTSATMFNDLGFTLTPDSMESFQTAVVPLLLGSFLIVIGNTGFPCMLRFSIWATSVVTPIGSGLWEELRFLLDHPRRCFTLLFPSKATWWLFWVLVLLNGLDLLFFVVLDLRDPTVTSLAPGFRVLNGWFQAVSTRTAGLSCVNLANLHPAIQVSYMIMMYISVFPIAISVRRTNVYEEKSLGIFGGEEDEGDAEQSYVGQHLRRQLSFDLWFIFLGFFIIAIAEGGRLQNTNEYAFTMFSVLFEIVSAYGTVGLSLGYPNKDESFSTEFNVLSKLVIIAMMIRGRHRGLPYALDRAILLPSEKLQQKEGQIMERRRSRSRHGSIYSERNVDEFRRNATWSQGELDENGLPKQHLRQTSSMDPTTMSAGDDQLQSVDHNRPSRPKRGQGIGRVLAAGFSAGPSFSKYE